jgi:hypothetical protein
VIARMLLWERMTWLLGSVILVEFSLFDIGSILDSLCTAKEPSKYHHRKRSDLRILKTKQIIASTSFQARKGQHNSEPPQRGHSYEIIDCG